MKTGTRIPPLRDLPPGRLEERRRHLLAEITNGEQSTTPTPGDSLRPGASPRRGIVRVAAVAAAALIVGSMLVWPWEGSPSLVERARAAIGDEPVLHVVTAQQRPFLGPIVEIDSGRVVPETRETEIWFDEGRALKKAVERHNGVVLDEVLETPQGGFTQGGPLITCAWIAAHPREATKLRVSCNENMENGTTPRQIPENPPFLDERLAGFLDHYRTALDSGRAEVIGTDTIDDRDVTWLRFRWSPPAQPERGAPPAEAGAPSAWAQDVAIDSSTYRPVRLRNEDGSWVTDVRVAETLPFRAEYFRRPAQAPPRPSRGKSKESRPIELAEARALLGRAPLWLGDEWRGLRLTEVTELELVTGYWPPTAEPAIASGIRLTYADGTAAWRDGPKIVISEAVTCNFSLLWLCGPHAAREGQLQRHGFLDTGLARIGGLHVTIQSRGAPPPPAERGRSWQYAPGVDPLTIARALRPLP